MVLISETHFESKFIFWLQKKNVQTMNNPLNTFTVYQQDVKFDFFYIDNSSSFDSSSENSLSSIFIGH